jgi:phospholipid/cholesterol/gamma-HCH transport system substrate-binding protein
MSKARQEWKVGVFVFIGLVLLGGLLLQFSKGTNLFRKTYDILLRSPNVGGGLKVRASVLMAGVQVGTVNDIKLGPQGTNVTITLRIYGEYVIHKDARFYIEQSGFLGDQYVAILPTKNDGDVYKDKEIADAQTPMNVMEIARSAAGFLQNVDQMTTRLQGVIIDVQGIVTNLNVRLLNSETLTNLATTARNLRTISEQAGTTMDNINALLATNAPVVNYAVSNLAGVTDRLGFIANGANDVVATNSPIITASLKNIETSTEQLKAVMNDVQAGKGLAGKVLQDPEMAANIQQIAVNLSVTTSNLNRLGLWGILWKKKAAPEHQPRREAPVLSPKDKAD